MSWLEDGAARSFCYLTTRGRKTGLPRRIEIWFAADGGRLYMLSGAGDGSDWVRNLRVNPEVQVELAGKSHTGHANVVSDPAEDALARRLLDGKYHGWREGRLLTDWAETALPVVVAFEE